MTAETNAEWLGQVKDTHRRRVRLSNESIDWLIEQAERAQVLEQQNSQLCLDIEFAQIANEGLKNLTKRMENEIVSLREALEDIEILASMNQHDATERIIDRASQARAGETNGQRKA